MTGRGIPYLITPRMAANIALDGTCAALAVALSFWLATPSSPWPEPKLLPLAGAVAIWLIGIPLGLARLHWRFVSLKDLAALGTASVMTAVMLVLLMIGAGLPLPSPAFPVILALALIAFLIGPKFAYRLLRQRTNEGGATQTAILVGNGESAELFLTAHAQAQSSAYRVTGLMTLSARHVGRRVHGLNVIGAVEHAAAALGRLREKPDLLIIVESQFKGDTLASLLKVGEQLAIRILRAPSVTRLLPAEQKLELQPIAIEDLLNRRQVQLDRTGISQMVSGQRVMVTGAGGSIGAELSRQIANIGPAELLLLDSSEFALWQIDLEISELAPGLPRTSVIADVRNAARIDEITQRFRPDLVFHAAALKHVPIVEANRLEGLNTNVLGTRNVANAAARSGAHAMVLISTDKAVNPSSVMGASKRLAEIYCQALDVKARHGAGMRCITVRFGNVLGSTGSVVPLFRRQLAQGGPITVTAPEMQRYFMTVREAVGLVIQAAMVGNGASAIPDGGIFVLDMGEPVKIIDLARQMIRLAGLQPDKDIQIQFTGLRPGEKLFEELFHGSETPSPTAHEGLLMATPRMVDLQIVEKALAELETTVLAGNESAAMTVLARLVPEFPGDGAISRAAE